MQSEKMQSGQQAGIIAPMSLTLSEITQRLLARDPLPPLVPASVYDPTLTPAIDALDAPALVTIGLHVLNDDLESAHPLSQELEGDPVADYWHAIIHRREGDYGNARYWFGRVGSLPVLTEIYGSDPAAPGAFVARCRTAGRRDDAELQEFQRTELAGLLDYAQHV